MTTHLLPSLKSNSDVPKITKAGTWETHRDPAILSIIAEGIEVQGETDGMSTFVSTPDAWAQLDLFQTALLQGDKGAIGRWRGLLALFGLAAESGYELRTEVVDLDQVSDRHPQGIARIMNTVPPRDNLIADRNDRGWGQIGVIRCDTVPVGLIVPTTLVCPMRTLRRRLPAMIFWQQNNELIDPCEARGITGREYLLLLKYIERLSDNVSAANVRANQDGSAVNNKLFGTLQTCLGQFRDDLGRAADRLGADRGEMRHFQETSRALPFPQQPIVGNLGILYNLSATGIVESDLVIRARADFRDYFKGAVLYDPRIADAWGHDQGGDVKLWGVNTLARVSRRPDLAEAQREEMQENGYLLLTPEELFLDRLWHVTPFDRSGGRATIPGHPTGFRDLLLPLRPQILLFYTPEQIRDRLGFSQDRQTEDITISFEVTLEQLQGGRRNYVIEKVYRQDSSDFGDIGEPFCLVQWPNFRSEHWSHYYLYANGATNLAFSIGGLFSVSAVTEDLEKTENKPERMRELHGLHKFVTRTNRNLLLSRSDEGDSSGRSRNRREIFEVESWPDALICRAPLENSRGEIEMADAGLLITQPAEEPVPVGEDFAVGIDIGTTNTTVYTQRGQQKPRPVVFRNRTLFPIEQDSQSERFESIQEALLLEFVPAYDVEVPFLTMFLEQRDVVLSEAGSRALWGRRVFFPNEIRSAFVIFAKERESRLRFNLKWREEPESRKLLGIFVRQIAMQTLAELVADGGQPDRVAWAYSYPEAFSQEQAGQYRTMFPVAFADAMASESRAPQVRRQLRGRIRHRSESVATALYFQEQFSAAFQDGVMTIDIGGHTSDVSLWQKGRMIWRDSLELGGQHILIAFYKHNLDTLDRLFEGQSKLLDLGEELRVLRNRSEELFTGGLEVVVNNEKYRETLEVQSFAVSGMEDMRRLKSLAEFALAGLIYYLAKQISWLGTDGRGFQKNTRVMQIYLGGRASELYRTQFDEPDLATLSSLFCRTAELSDKKGVIRFSNAPKHEVAYGLLIDSRAVQRPEDVKVGGVIGESITINGQAKPPVSAYQDLDLEADWTVEDVPELKAFIAEYRKAYHKTVPLDDDLRLELVGRLNQSVHDAHERYRDYVTAERGALPDLEDDEDANGDEALQVIAMEPLFIVALRELLSLLLERNLPIHGGRS